MVQVLRQVVRHRREQVDIDSWENKRGPRPWENSREVQGGTAVRVPRPAAALAGRSEEP